MARSLTSAGTRPLLAVWVAWTLVVAASGVVVLTIALGIPNHRTIQGFLSNDLLGISLGLATPFIGALIVQRHRRNPVAWVLLLTGLGAAVTSGANEWVTRAFVVAPGSLPGATIANWTEAWTWVLQVGAIPLLLLLFPHGSLPSRRWRVVLWVAVVVLALQMIGGWATWPLRGSPGLNSDGPPPSDIPILTKFALSTFPILLVVVILAVVSLVARMARARGEERQQIKWFVYAASLTGLGFLFTNFFPGHPFAYAILQAFCTAIVCGAIGAAILRYRLYDIDRIISRSVAYVLVLGVLVGAYLLVVLTLSTLSPLSKNSPAVVAVSTLLVAAMFRPLLMRVRRVVDRRFNRARYDTERTLAAFSAHLRDEVDLSILGERLLGVVDETMRPATLGLWLRSEPGNGRT